MRWALIGSLLTAGCDKVPWPFNKQTGDAARSALTATSAQAPQASVPTKPTVPETEILAKVGEGGVVSKADFELRVEELKTFMTGVGRPWRVPTQKELEGLLQELVQTELMSQDAVKRGLDRSKQVQQRWEYVRRGFNAQEWMRTYREMKRIEAPEIEKFYNENKAGFLFLEAERRRVRQIVVNSEEQANKVVTNILSRTADFMSLAQQLSESPIEIPGWVMRRADRLRRFADEAEAQAAQVSSLEEALETAAFAVDRVDGISLPVKGADGKYHVFQLVERQESRQRPLTEVYDGIKNHLLTQQLAASLADLEKQTTIKRYEERLSTVAQ
jgi:hypothetical protein